jgi:Dullard-like phosphatase family protein
MSTSVASPYGAPNTPIASAKRLRLKVARSEPRTSNHQGSPEIKATGSKRTDESENAPVARKLAFKPPTAKCVSSQPEEPKTPSKIMFSPALRAEVDAKRGVLMSSSGYCDDDGELDDTTHSNTPDEEIKQTAAEMDCDEPSLEEDQDQSEDDINAFNPYLFIAELPPHQLVQEHNKICLPAFDKLTMGSKKTLVLDLDETLVHCTVAPMTDPDLIFPVLFNGIIHQVYVRKRPYLDHFLETVSKNFEVVLFTASQKVYADVLLDKLDPKTQFIKHRLFREACLCVQGNYLKDLTVLNRDLSRTMIVDNSPYAYAYQLSNGIPIESWYDDANDTELLKLIGFLAQLEGVEDVRPSIRNHFKSHQLVSMARAGRPISLLAPPF